VFTALPRLLRTVRPDILIADMEPENYGGLEAVLCARLRHPHPKVVLASWRNIDYAKVGLPYKWSASHRFCERMVRRLQPNLLIIRATAGIPLVQGLAREILPLPFAVDCSVFTPPAPERSLPGGRVVIGYLGRLVDTKGLLVLLDAIAGLQENVTLRLIGRGPLEEELKRRASAPPLLGRVEVHPPVPYARVPDVLRDMDILVLPSLESRYWTEQFGRVLAEGMACGRPIVASRSGEIPTVLGNGGVCVDPGDASKLRDALSQLVRDPAMRARVGAAGRSRALELYDVPVVAATLGSALRRVATIRL
jgi:glycosyltransferase involved in cell wall biosynthesis